MFMLIELKSNVKLIGSLKKKSCHFFSLSNTLLALSGKGQKEKLG